MRSSPFVMAVRAILSGTSNEVTQPSLQKFLIEANLFKYVGLNLDDLRSRPHQEAVDYVQIATLFANDEAARAAAAKKNAKNGGGA